MPQSPPVVGKRRGCFQGRGRRLAHHPGSPTACLLSPRGRGGGGAGPRPPERALHRGAVHLSDEACCPRPGLPGRPARGSDGHVWRHHSVGEELVVLSPKFPHKSRFGGPTSPSLRACSLLVLGSPHSLQGACVPTWCWAGIWGSSPRLQSRLCHWPLSRSPGLSEHLLV